MPKAAVFVSAGDGRRVLPSMLVRPDHGALLYDQYWSVSRTQERAVFRRCFDPQYGCDPPHDQHYGREHYYHPGARISILTDADRVHTRLEYGVGCRSTCAGTPPNECYHPPPGNGFMRGTCVNHCEVKLFVDGRQEQLPASSRRDRFEEKQTDHILLLELDGSDRKVRKVEVVMPWGGEVHFLGFELQRTDEQTPSLQRPHGSSFRFLAYGDSITQGYCAPTPYPEVIGRLNGWNAVNLGIGGLKISPRHGTALGQASADLVLIFIGTNDWWRGCDVAPGISSTISNIRDADRAVPVAVVTMLVRADEPGRSPKHCIVLEDFRQQIRDEVSRRRNAGDARLYLIEGKPLLSVERLGDGLHPGDESAMAELGHNLNAQLGFSAVQYSAACDATLRVDARGLTPGGIGILHWGSEPMRNSILGHPCRSRSIMVGAEHSIQSAVDSNGHVTFAVPINKECSAINFQVLDAMTCTISRVGQGKDPDSALGSAAENFPTLHTLLPSQPPPLPFSPSPQAPPSPRPPPSPQPPPSPHAAATPPLLNPYGPPAQQPLFSPPWPLLVSMPPPSLRQPAPSDPLEWSNMYSPKLAGAYARPAIARDVTLPQRFAPSALPTQLDSTQFLLDDPLVMVTAGFASTIVLALLVACLCRAYKLVRQQLPQAHKFQEVAVFDSAGASSGQRVHKQRHRRAPK